MIKALDTEQDNPLPEPSGAGSVAGVAPAEPTDTPFLTLEEKRRILARIGRVDPLDCFDETGAFDIVRAKRVLPPGAVRHIAVHETTRLNAEGQPVTERRINVHLVDPVSALRLDDQLERRRERTASSSSSDSSPKTFSRRDFNRLREKTMALDDANQSIALLKKALAEADDRELQLSKELEEKDRQLSKTLSKVEGDAIQPSTGHQPIKGSPKEPELVGQALRLPEFPNTPEPNIAFDAENLSPSSPSLPNRSLEAQSNTCHQPVSPKHQNPSPPQNPSATKTWLPTGLQWPQNLSSAEKQILENLDEIEIQIRKKEVEDMRNTSGPGAFSEWFRAWSREVANDRSPAARRSPRPPVPPPATEIPPYELGRPRKGVVCLTRTSAYTGVCVNFRTRPYGTHSST